MTYFRKFCYLNSSCIRKSITLMFMSFSKNKFTLLLQTRYQMFLLVSARHVGVHPGEHQHGVSIQISISLGKTFLRISLWPESSRGSLYMYLLSFHRFWTLSNERFWFLFWSILNGVTWHWKPAIEFLCTKHFLFFCFDIYTFINLYRYFNIFLNSIETFL